MTISSFFVIFLISIPHGSGCIRRTATVLPPTDAQFTAVSVLPHPVHPPGPRHPHGTRTPAFTYHFVVSRPNYVKGTVRGTLNRNRCQNSTRVIEHRILEPWYRLHGGGQMGGFFGGLSRETRFSCAHYDWTFSAPPNHVQGNRSGRLVPDGRGATIF